jgi:hypothetical protein
MRKGRNSTIMPTDAAISAISGDMKSIDPRKAQTKPAAVPSTVLPLENGILFLPYILPTIDADPSPSVTIEMAA